MVFLAIWGVAQQSITTFSCVPLERLIPKWHGRCIPTTLAFNLNAIMNMVTDFAILAIPIWSVAHLQLPRKRKIHLLAVFCLGFFACAISIIRLNELSRTKGSKDQSWDGSAAAYWSTIELNVSILCAYLPTLWPLIERFAPRLLGSSNQAVTYNLTHQLGAIQTSRSTKLRESRIYIQKEVEFESTTELRLKKATKHPSSVRGESFDDVISKGPPGIGT